MLTKPRAFDPLGQARFFLFLKLSVRDGGIELPITVWKTVVIPFN